MCKRTNTDAHPTSQHDTQESILDNQTDLTAKFDTFGFGHTATTGIELSRETFDFLRWASNGPNTTISNPNHHQLPAAKILAQTRIPRPPASASMSQTKYA
jgi:outer membrane receptor for monomeric catechols